MNLNALGPMLKAYTYLDPQLITLYFTPRLRTIRDRLKGTWVEQVYLDPKP